MTHQIELTDQERRFLLLLIDQELTLTRLKKLNCGAVFERAGDVEIGLAHLQVLDEICLTLRKQLARQD